MPDKDQIGEMIDYYDDRTPYHDDFMSFTTIEDHFNTFKDIVEFIKPLADGNATLELASGTGNWTSVLASFSKKVISVDSSPRSLELAKVKLKDYNNIEYHKLNIINDFGLPEKFDLIFSADFISHIPYQHFEKYLSNLKKILNKNGTLIHIDISYHEYFQQKESTIDNFGNWVYNRLLSNGKEYQVIKNFPDIEKIKTLFNQDFPNTKMINLPIHKRYMIISKL